MDNHVSTSTSIDPTTVTVGSHVLVKVGCRTIDAVVLDVLENGWRVKSISTGKEFDTTRIVGLNPTPAQADEEAAAEAAPTVEEVPVEPAPAEEAAQPAEPASEEAPVEATTEEPAPLSEEAPAEAAPTTAEAAATEATPRVKKRSLIEAAAEILKESAEPMNTRSMVQAAIERGLWTPTNCKTPEQSLYGAIFREIKVSATPRFRKSATRGAFEYVS